MFSYQSQNQLRKKTLFTFPAFRLSHLASARLFTGCFTCGQRCCRRWFMVRVVNCLRWRSCGNINPLSNRGSNERLCFESSKSSHEQFTKGDLAFYSKRKNLRSWLLMKAQQINQKYFFTLTFKGLFCSFFSLNICLSWIKFGIFSHQDFSLFRSFALLPLQPSPSYKYELSVLWSHTNWRSGWCSDSLMDHFCTAGWTAGKSHLQHPQERRMTEEGGAIDLPLRYIPPLVSSLCSVMHRQYVVCCDQVEALCGGGSHTSLFTNMDDSSRRIKETGEFKLDSIERSCMSSIQQVRRSSDL